MGNFEVRRSATIAADPALVHRLLNDFHEWRAWSPWEDLDPELERTFTGPDAGVGAHYAWQGNRKAGQGTMEITGSTPARIDVQVSFLKPWKATNNVHFDITPSGGGSEVTWVMTGQYTGLLRVFSRVMSMDKLVGRDFEKGLARLRTTAEA